MKFDVKKEIALMTITLIPILYLIYVWNLLPIEVPIHYNINMDADRYSNKTIFALIIISITLLTYIPLLVWPLIDPKKKIKEMGNKFYHLKFIIVGSSAMISFFITYKTIYPATNLQFMLVILGLIYIALGNYYQTIKQNYFLGIRTPWSLENETNWKKTHRIAGISHMLGGFIVCLSYFLLPTAISFYFSIGTMLLIGVIPYVYSFLIFKKTNVVNE